MRLDTLEKRMLYYRGLTDYKLMPKLPVIIMLDGRAFSKFCKRFEKPYDDIFISMMNETAKYLCENIEGCKFAYTQSDEISLYLSDADNENSESWFGYRIIKMCSIAASLATAKFNQLLLMNAIKGDIKCPMRLGMSTDYCDIILKEKLVEFDCKVWNVPSLNDVFAWFLFRQIDCARNSKQMAAQSYFSHSDLEGLNTDKQIEELKKHFNIDWHQYSDDKKFGRFIYKEEVEIPYEIPDKFKNGVIPPKMLENIITLDSEDGTEYYIIRNKWMVHNGFELTNEDGKKQFYNILGWQQ